MNFRWLNQPKAYQAVSRGGPGQYDDPEEKLGGPEGQGRACACRRRLYIMSALNALVFCISVPLVVQSQLSLAALKSNKDNALLRASDWYSPIHDQIQIDVLDTQTNGSLLDMDGSIYRSPPSAEADAAWERISNLQPHVITTQDVIRLGKDPTKAAKFPEDWGYGPEAYIANIDVMHAIHCLDAVRRDVHWKHYFGDKFPDGEFDELHKIHTDHCIYIILQDLMCHATADMITLPWVDGQLHPFPDFSINRKCRDFDSILRWHEETRIEDIEGYNELRRPKDVVPYRMLDEFHELFQTDVGRFAPFHTHHHDV